MNPGIGISGMGRIGRLLIRRLMAEHSTQLKAINSMHPIETIAHLLKYDSIHGTWDAAIWGKDDALIINGHSIQVIYEPDPSRIPWQALGVEIVIDATGKFNNRESAEQHKAGGASTVIISAPGDRMDLTVVMGVNDHQYHPRKHTLLSAASCTTNCLSPVLFILDQAYGVERGWMTTIHSFTSDQRHLDNPHKDLRRARGCTQSIVPTSTGVGKSLIDVLPHLSGCVEGTSIRVPTQDVSLIDLTLRVSKEMTTEDVQGVLREAARGAFSAYVDYTEEPLVSADFIGNDKSAVIDGLTVSASDGFIKLMAWYDNEWGYASRVIDLTHLVQERMSEA
ncbi:glyceraldehyde 3-phosphate dehydrogenase [Paenibacillus sp. LBL]|uniref:type I glyceraldehyde-3-phosphate dehydrogenase n=1 Tax=Paenibacillus TaxID=44249 RepID=UPI00128E60B8|nr:MULTISPECIES: type I glyceraldehyde-3-phosphate dehydrogenase [Paenibacillus]MDH6670070.1 glyceraldehyde 3-phosphate dehydrogenase [Paenibacillus sp. LBL]MPY16718.1 type I glyceraldehyde-3-phosphate dehydrogenase [Paenibacillus glucanolyticus]